MHSMLYSILQRRRLLAAITVLIGAFAAINSQAPAQQKKDEPRTSATRRTNALLSPEIHADHSVTFRLRAPNAKEVQVWGDLSMKTRPLTRDDGGNWSLTIGPLPPELYSYGFIVDGLRILDPSNTRMKPMRSNSTSYFDIPGDPPLLHDYQDVPHGTVHLHDYRSQLLQTLRRLRVYTPPGYDRDPAARYPTLYLFHGSGDNEATWTEVGRAQVILDNLISQKKAKPMVIVMTDGHAVSPSADNRARSMEAFQSDLLKDVIPFVESYYRLKPDRLNRAIIGLSMGGGQSLTIGLNHLDQFAWVGGMSTAVRDAETTIAAALTDPQVNDKLKLLWIAIGKDDGILKAMEQTEMVLLSHQIRHTYRITEGNHSWPVWRKHLAEFTPLIFVD